MNGPALAVVNESLVFLVVIVPADARCLSCIDCQVSTAKYRLLQPGWSCRETYCGGR
jgi:hypothetical protein